MEQKWWHSAVVYQVYPRSFKDSNGDGIGDLPGIIEKLDYLQDLGITVIWLSPVYKSPMDDNGYDISDYRAIAPEFGTLKDMDRLIAEAGRRGIKVMMDLVVNHTSDEHPWFLAAEESRDNPYREYYIFRDPLADGSVPNALKSCFSGPAWTLSEKTGQYYCHLFSKRQPDLNWQNPKVAEEVHAMMNWWLDRGIGGFRMDVIDLIGKDIDQGITGNGPKLHQMLHAMNRATFGQCGREIVTVGETWGVTPEGAKLYSNPERDELSMVFQFEHVMAFHHETLGKWRSKPVDFQVLKGILAKWQTELASEGWNSLFWNNHDLPRAVSKYGSDGPHRVVSAKMLATMIHCMKGTPYIYQGEEIGMTNVAFEQLSDYKDIETLNAYKELVGVSLTHDEMMAGIYANGRDNARTPMQWSSAAEAGFTAGEPWIRVNPNYSAINVAESVQNPEGIYQYYKKLIALRKTEATLVYGDFEWLCQEAPDLFVYKRTYHGDEWLIVINHTEQACAFQAPEEIQETKWSLTLSNYEHSTESNSNASLIFGRMAHPLKPYEVLVLRQM